MHQDNIPDIASIHTGRCTRFFSKRVVDVPEGLAQPVNENLRNIPRKILA
jgi:hypothetical protein